MRRRLEGAGWSRLDLAALAAVTLFAGAIRTYHAHRPWTVFDEGQYHGDGCWYWIGSSTVCRQPGEINPEHPPLGKWLIGAGIELSATAALAGGWRR